MTSSRRSRWHSLQTTRQRERKKAVWSLDRPPSVPLYSVSHKSATIRNTVGLRFVAVVSDGTEQRQTCGSTFAAWCLLSVRSCRSLWAHYIYSVTTVPKLRYCLQFHAHEAVYCSLIEFLQLLKFTSFKSYSTYDILLRIIRLRIVQAALRTYS
jgi:hypothetical protein